MAIEDVVNQALDVLGYARHIGNIFDGTVAAKIALNAWGQTRDSLLNVMEPDWAKKDAVLTLVKSAPNIQGSSANYTAVWNSATNPPIPWLYEYTTPSDCIKPLQIKPPEVLLPVWRPRAHPYRQIITDTTDTIVTNTPDAILIYTARVLDPDMWHEDFRDAMIQMLAKKMQAELSKSPPPPQREQQNADAAG